MEGVSVNERDRLMVLLQVAEGVLRGEADAEAESDTLRDRVGELLRVWKALPENEGDRVGV